MSFQVDRLEQDDEARKQRRKEKIELEEKYQSCSPLASKPIDYDEEGNPIYYLEDYLRYLNR